MTTSKNFSSFIRKYQIPHMKGRYLDKRNPSSCYIYYKNNSPTLGSTYM
jgi:hypothetical protein